MLKNLIKNISEFNIRNNNLLSQVHRTPIKAINYKIDDEKIDIANKSLLDQNTCYNVYQMLHKLDSDKNFEIFAKHQNLLMNIAEKDNVLTPDHIKICKNFNFYDYDINLDDNTSIFSFFNGSYKELVEYYLKTQGKVIAITNSNEQKSYNATKQIIDKGENSYIPPNIIKLSNKELNSYNLHNNIKAFDYRSNYYKFENNLKMYIELHDELYYKYFHYINNIYREALKMPYDDAKDFINHEFKLLKNLKNNWEIQ